MPTGATATCLQQMVTVFFVSPTSHIHPRSWDPLGARLLAACVSWANDFQKERLHSTVSYKKLVQCTHCKARPHQPYEGSLLAFSHCTPSLHSSKVGAT